MAKLDSIISSSKPLFRRASEMLVLNDKTREPKLAGLICWEASLLAQLLHALWCGVHRHERELSSDGGLVCGGEAGLYVVAAAIRIAAGAWNNAVILAQQALTATIGFATVDVSVRAFEKAASARASTELKIAKASEGGAGLHDWPITARGVPSSHELHAVAACLKALALLASDAVAGLVTGARRLCVCEKRSRLADSAHVGCL